MQINRTHDLTRATYPAGLQDARRTRCGALPAHPRLRTKATTHGADPSLIGVFKAPADPPPL